MKSIGKDCTLNETIICIKTEPAEKGSILQIYRTSRDFTLNKWNIQERRVYRTSRRGTLEVEPAEESTLLVDPVQKKSIL